MTMRRTIAAAALGILTAACGTSEDTVGFDETVLTTITSVPITPSTASTAEPAQPSGNTVATTTPTVPDGLAPTSPAPAAATTDPDAAVDGQTIVRFSAGRRHHHR